MPSALSPQRAPAQLVVLVPEIPLLSGIKFNTLATAIGFKPKKPHPPPLTLGQYPPVRTVVTPPAAHLVPRTDTSSRRPYTAPSAGIGRAPSNSVSSSRSRGDSIEPNTPKTPEDPAQVRRGSLLTLSDADPFAARVVSLHSPSDPNRLSAFSHNSSAHDVKSNESANRVSYASSSSQSFRMGGDLSPRSIASPVSEAGSSLFKLSNKLSGPSLRRKDETWLSNLGGDPNRLSDPDPPPKPRPAMRARGMTDGGIERSSFLRSDPFMARTPSPKQSPKFPSRQASLSRPTPPPKQELPPPPPSSATSADDRAQALGQSSAGSVSSSSLTFSAEFSPISPRSRGKQQAYEPSPKSQVYDPSPKTPESGWEPDARSHRTLKKSISHQSLNKQRLPSTSTVPLPESAAQKGPRKQRSFTQHRLPVPAVPLQLPLSEQRASDPALSTRKRLFSGSSSRRPSQSTLALTDDARSLNIAPEQEITASTSLLDRHRRAPAQPGQIMSPAEMLQVEASVEAAYQRPRTESIVSASTAMSDFEHDFGLSPLSPFGMGRKRSNSDHPSMWSTTTSEVDLYYNQPLAPPAPQPPSPPILMSLPPPPRHTKSRTSSLSRSQSELVTPLSPPPRRNLRPKVSVEERMHRQSIMRKPSFLDIDDEYDKEDLEPPPELPKHKPMPRQASFLDLTRDSFDSMRSVDIDYN
ncbi:hypothetical protein MVEN_01522900 [Mycena venus]|uniref:Uncharacterized protein n=1 Tax=Mycena venus TaxID=2733690 RepID=A0A8H6XWF1_9AGAR|nr:hypothetical protein MVEN_01522900 [Mycena venus]